MKFFEAFVGKTGLVNKKKKFFFKPFPFVFCSYRSCLHFVVYIQTPHGPRPKQMGKAEEIINRMERIVKAKKWTE